ncbi:opsin family protein [Aspergillus ruber CBS 135680]|uniref:Putative opsin n=1 Tax=Aspergillus ruber (strain CBS 135680) TaxID=1388766 RepID=A0A017SDA4_ASPRC|nr:putative opsin [Aspergillus ruber CBS 135680]EYE94993.1 putative opsin [Aspergillus ruber CBS 135680]
MIESFATKTSLPPIPTSSPSVGPVPTVIPGPSAVLQEIHETGKRTLWVVAVLMALSSLVFYVLTSRAPLSKRILHTLVAITTTISFITYMALATGTGTAWNHSIFTHAHKHVPDTTEHHYRQILYLRYINWFLTNPLMLINLALLSGLPGANLLVAIVADFVMLSSGLLGTFTDNASVKWVWFVVSCVGYLVTVYQVGIHGTRAASGKDSQRRRFYGTVAGATLLAKVLYPIVLAAGGIALKLNVDAETILFAILDIFTQGILGYWLLIAYESVAGTTLYLDGFWSRGIGNEGAIRITDEDGDGA